MRAVNIFLVTTFAGVILAPVSAQLVDFNQGRSLEENRTLAQPIALPKNWTDAISVPSRTDDYLRDHFGLRRLALQTHDTLVWYVLGESPSVQVTRGRDGMLFFNSHGAERPYSLIAQSCGIGLPSAAIAPMTEDVKNFLKQAQQVNPNSTLVIIPTKAPVYPELLPAWLSERCRFATPPTRVIEQQLRGEPQLASMLDYPLDEMRSLKTSIKVYPPQSFHWAGDMPRHLAEQMSEKSFGLAKIRTFKAHTIVVPSDLQHFVPGVTLWMETFYPDYAAAGVRPCVGSACFPELGKINERLGVSRFQSGGSGKKLLLISDSFGAAIAGWYSQYFSEVWHLDVGILINVPDDQVSQVQLFKTMFLDFAPDRVVYLFHDGTAFAPRPLTKFLSMGAVVTTLNGADRR